MTHPVSSKSMTILFDLLHVNGPPTGITSENSQVAPGHPSFFMFIKNIIKDPIFIFRHNKPLGTLGSCISAPHVILRYNH